MPSHTWTAAALPSEARAFSALCWRAVESQYAAATMTLADGLEEQALLEDLIEDTKPPVPPGCEGMHYLLFSPFRYSVGRDSRFHRKGETPGVFYAAREETTAIAEIAFWRLLFFAESPHTPWPAAPVEYTLFSLSVSARAALDLTSAPFDRDEDLWRDPLNYEACQNLGAQARKAGLDAILYKSVRAPREGINIVLLHCRAIASRAPEQMKGWRMRLHAHGVMARQVHGEGALDFGRQTFARDPRIRAMNWDR